MKRTLGLLIVLVALLLPLMQIAAQEAELCSADQIVARIGIVYNTYSSAASDDGDLETSLNSIDALNAEIDAIYAECDEARFQAYLDEGTALLQALRGGGYVLYVRHAATNPDETDDDLSSCETQRNLSVKGREDAAMIGEIWTTLAIPVERIISTEYCRTRDTAQLAFGEPTVIPREELEISLDELLAVQPAEGMNTIIVGHVDLLEEATGIQIPEDVILNEGDALVYGPQGGAMGSGGYELVARIGLRNWADLGRIAAQEDGE